MREGRPPIASTSMALLVVIAGCAIAGANGLLSSTSRAAIYILAMLILSFDMVDLIVRLWLKRLHGAASCGPSVELGLVDISNVERTLALRPYAIIASVHDESDSIDRLAATLKPFKELVWLIDDASSDDTLLRLRRDGWKCFSTGTNKLKPGALLQLLKTLPVEIQTVVVMDPDVTWAVAADSERPILEQVISDLQRSGAAALTPRVLAKDGGWLVDCQALEYELACSLGRKSLRDLCCNSGVSVYQRAALEEALGRHSLSVYAEDLENSLLLLAEGQQIYYDDRWVIATHGKRTWRSLFSQRVGWSFGCVKLLVERWPLFLAIARRDPLGAYQYIFYLGIMGIGLLPLKWLSIAILVMSFLRAIDDLLMTHLIPAYSWNEPLLFALWYLKSLAMLLIACLATLPRGARARHLSTLPFYSVYALLQYIPITVGFFNMLSLRVLGRRLYIDHYATDQNLFHKATATSDSGA